MKAVPPVLLAYTGTLKAHDVDANATTAAEDLRFGPSTSVRDKERFLGFLRSLLAGFTDWRYDHDEPKLRDDGIAVKSRHGGTHTGTFALTGMAGVPATGKQLSIPECFSFIECMATRWGRFGLTRLLAAHPRYIRAGRRRVIVGIRQTRSNKSGGSNVARVVGGIRWKERAAGRIVWHGLGHDCESTSQK
jgi:hypothetical protein